MSMNVSSLETVKNLRDFFIAQNSKELKKAYDAFNSPFEIDEEELETLFNRYFIGPMDPLADPYASIYIDATDSVMSSSTLQVRDLYKIMGFTYPYKNIIPEDFIGIELDAYYQLLYLEEIKHITYLRELRHYFLYEHLAFWLPKFIERTMSKQSEASNAIHFIIIELKSLLIRETTTQGVLE